jgi:hypothetical protein
VYLIGTAPSIERGALHGFETPTFSAGELEASFAAATEPG